MRRIVVGLGVDIALRGQPDLAGVSMGDAGHQVVVNPGQPVHRLGNPVNLGQAFIAKNVAILHLDADNDHVGAAKGLLDFVVQLDIAVTLWQ